MPGPPRMNHLTRYEVDENGCWLFTGSIKKDGYGIIGVRPADGPRTSMNAHRYFYLRLVGPIPDGLQLDHLCRVHRCVNPEHLEPVTNGENVRRGLTGRGVFACGHRLTPENTIQQKDQRRCRTCLRLRDAAEKRKWRAANPDKMRARNRAYYEANAERIKATERARWHAKHPKAEVA